MSTCQMLSESIAVFRMFGSVYWIHCSNILRFNKYWAAHSWNCGCWILWNLASSIDNAERALRLWLRNPWTENSNSLHFSNDWLCSCIFYGRHAIPKLRYSRNINLWNLYNGNRACGGGPYPLHLEDPEASYQSFAARGWGPQRWQGWEPQTWLDWEA